MAKDRRKKWRKMREKKIESFTYRMADEDRDRERKPELKRNNKTPDSRLG